MGFLGGGVNPELLFFGGVVYKKTMSWLEEKLVVVSG